jgi:hypothetical protein
VQAVQCGEFSSELEVAMRTRDGSVHFIAMGEVIGVLVQGIGTCTDVVLEAGKQKQPVSSL